ncbi:hypothetical protein J6590_108042, partial [Homalodisca vitripennis]
SADFVNCFRARQSAGDGAHNPVRLTGVKLCVCVVCSTSQKQTRSRYWCPGCDCGVHLVATVP